MEPCPWTCEAVLLHLLQRQDHHAGALLEPGADFGERLDLLDGDVGLAHTPWSYNMGCWLLLLVEAGAASCRQSVGGSTAGVMWPVGLLLLIEMGQSMRTVAESSFCFQESSKARPAHAQKMLSFGEHSLSSAPPDNPKRPTQTWHAVYID